MPPMFNHAMTQTRSDKMDDQQKNEQIKGVVDMAAAAGWDTKPLSLAHEIMGFLEGVKDQGTSIDSGTNGTTGDLWVTIQGVEYFIQVGKSRGQLVKEGILPPPV